MAKNNKNKKNNKTENVNPTQKNKKSLDTNVFEKEYITKPTIDDLEILDENSGSNEEDNAKKTLDELDNLDSDTVDEIEEIEETKPETPTGETTIIEPNETTPDFNDEETILINADTPPSKRRKTTKFKDKTKKQKAKFIALVSAAILVIFIAILSAVGLYFYAKIYSNTTDVNESTFHRESQGTVILDRNGDEITTISVTNSNPVELKNENGELNVSEYYINGLIAIEDEKFYRHHGINIFGLTKATITTILTDNDRGGSTITMQIGKLIYMQEWLVFDPETGMNRVATDPIEYKLTQMAYARKIEKEFSKDEILEAYINTIYFGVGGYGIQNASEYFYGKDPKDLTLAESAFLAGMTQLPTKYNPYENPELVTERRNQVLDRMLEVGSITQQEYDEAIATDIMAGMIPEEDHVVEDEEKYVAYTDVVIKELYDIFDPEYTEGFDPATAGMTVYTNMDPNLQTDVYDAINNPDPDMWVDEYIQTGAAIIDTQTGDILAVGNGRNDHQTLGGTNFAYDEPHQPGSTAKPILDYAPAVEYLGWSTAHLLVDEPISYDGGTPVYNHDLKYEGELTMQRALAESRNTTALYAFKQVSQSVGLDKILYFGQGLGLTDLYTNEAEFNQAYALGGWIDGTTPVELAGAYAAFGNGGTYNEPKAIDHIEFSTASPYYSQYGDSYTVVPESNTAMKPSTAFIITQMLDLTNKEAAGNASRALIPGMGPQSGKTGTSNWSANDYGIPDGSQKDKWLVNYTPDITTVTWTGYTNEYYSQGYYIPYGTKYEGYVMQDMLEDVPYYDDEYLHDDTFEQPSNVVSVPLNPNVNPSKPYPNYWPYTKMEGGEEHWFIVGSQDYNQIQEDYKSTKAPKPNLTTSQTDKNVTLTWDYTGSNRNTSKWNIYVDGKLYKTTDQTSITIATTDLAKVAGCKTTYKVEVELVEGNSKNQTRTSERASATITLPNTDFCKTAEPASTPAPAPTPTTPDPPATTTPVTPTPSNMFFNQFFKTSLFLIK